MCKSFTHSVIFYQTVIVAKMAFFRCALHHAITDGSGDLKVGAILALGGAIAGIVFCFVSLKAKLPVKLISLIVSVAGGIYILLNYLNLAPWARKAVSLLNKGTGTHIGIGLIVIIIGWVIACVGWLQTRD